LPNVDIMVRKADSLLWACRRACGASWGLRPKVVHWLNISIIWPSITLASLVWWPDYQMVNAKKRPSRIQRLVCLGITGAMHTRPTGAMEALGLPPLELVIQGMARSAAHCLWRQMLAYLHPSRGHGNILMRLQRSDPVFIMGVDVTSQLLILNPNLGLLCY
jgi:hypothetical protein